MARKRSATPAKPPTPEPTAPAEETAIDEASPTADATAAAETEAPASEPTTDEGQAEAAPAADPGISEAEEEAIASSAPLEPPGKHPRHEPKVMPVPDKSKLGNRIFAHPQADVLQSGFSVWIPGQEIHPEDVDEEFWKMIHREGLVVTEGMYKLNFPDLWNKAHPTEQVASPTNAALEAIDAPAEKQAVGEIK